MEKKWEPEEDDRSEITCSRGYKLNRMVAMETKNPGFGVLKRMNP